jgi:4-amino-4-deoxy-L-arabinose transferase-like glycosyltransferase
MPRPRALIYLAPIAAIGLVLGVRAVVTTAPLDRLAAATSDAKDPPATTARAGYLAIARGGPVIVGFVSPGPARLTVGDHDVAGTGLVKDRVILPAGPIAIRFAAPTGARLVWSPVGRRGDPEYVPASSLAVDPSDLGGGAAPLDGAFAALILLIVVGSLCLLARHRLAAVSRETWIAMGAIVALACFVRWFGLSDHGQTWDEDVNWSAGRNYITNLLSLDFHADAWSWNFEHPPIMKDLEGIGAQFADGFGPARALSAIWIALGCALLVPIGARLFSFRTGVLAAGIAALLPPLVAHGQIVGHEAPSVLWWNLAILLALGVPDAETVRATRIRIAWVGIAIGIAIASRFVNGFVGVLALAIIAIRMPPDRRWRTTLEAAVAMPLIAFATLYVVWPRMWLHPIGALQQSLAKLGQTHSTEPFLGAMTVHPGPSYFVLYLGATLPLGVLIGVVLFGVRAARRRDASTAIALCWLVVPLLVGLSPVRQDGVRYVMPSVVALAVLAAAGFDFAARSQRIFGAVAAALAIYLGITLVRVQPYYLDYFAEQVGGAGTVAAHGWFETAWWGEGVDRAVEYVNDHAAPGAHVFRDCIEPAHLAWFRADLWTPMVRSPAQADWIVTYAPQTHPCPVPSGPSGFRRVFAVDANGATLAEVWRK